MARRVCSAVTATEIGLAYLLLPVPGEFRAAGYASTILTLLTAGLGGWWVGNRVASWYITETLGWDQ